MKPYDCERENKEPQRLWFRHGNSSVCRAYGKKERVTEVSHWWDSQGENEIDLMALGRLDRQVIVAEVKRNPKW